MSVPDVSPDLPSRKWRVILALLSRLPQAGMSRTFGRLADLPIPLPLRKPVLGRAVRMLGIDMGEAERPLETYRTLNDLFVRKLRPGVRIWPHDPRTVASPVDGVLGQLGEVRDDVLIQAKGREYRASDLLGGVDAERYARGSFITLYLSPRHYHRIHAPIEGAVVSAWHLPGALLPVNSPAVTAVDNLFPRNERLVCLMESSVLGRVAVVAIGATNVGRISAAFDPDWNGEGGEGWITNRRGGVAAESRRYDPALPTTQGAQIMAFHLGSTVVLLLEKRVRLDPAATPGREVRMGEVLARAL